ncbi:hypothetical protein [Helicobacter rodentium]|uniref:hypothetical protein n=1 Tax=Helicobacter rodentium TaxID=59617 RepID=UPI000478D033|nr:hypothetical protein [Helicobacter rodentium]
MCARLWIASGKALAMTQWFALCHCVFTSLSLRGMSKANDEAIYNNEKRKISQWNLKSLELQSFVKFNICGIMDCHECYAFSQ